MRRQDRAKAIIAVLVLAAVVIGAVWWYNAYRVGRVRAPKGRREVTVQALWYSPDAEGAPSGTSRVVVRIDPNDIPGARVGFFEQEAQGTGQTWQASAWMATVVASLTGGIDLLQYVPSFSVGGRIDGPSAGGLLAVAVLACLTEADLRPDATLTGTISPDGTIGPVGGLGHKIDAAAQAGLKLVLIPQGQRQETDAKTGDPVDLVERGRSKGIEVAEVEDVVAAYERLTGRMLRQPRVAPGVPKLSGAVQKELEARAKTWLTTYRQEAAECERLRQRLGAMAGQVAEQLAAAKASGERAEQRLAEGRLAPAYDQAVSAALQASATSDVLKALAALQSGDMRQATRTVVPRDDRDEEVGITAAQLADLVVSTPDGLLAGADSLGIVAQAGGLLRARRGLQTALQSAPNDAGSVDLLFRAAALKGLDRQLLPIARDHAMLVASRKGPTPGPESRLTAWGTTMRRAAGASLAYFETVAIAETARSLGLHPDLLRDSTVYGDPTYLVAQASLVALPDLAQQLGGKRENDLAALGASVGAYAAGSALVTKFCSLRVKVNQGGEVIGIADEQALDRLAKSAEARALRDIAAARAAGLDASIPTYYYLIAAEYAAGDTDERLEGLQCYWQASLYARIGRLLAGDH